MVIVYILAAILVIGLLIAIHELGHFLAAKFCGVRVNEFSIGMGPILLHRTKGETEYTLRAFPIGGFCAMEGEEEASDDARSLSQQGFWKKLLIFAAGSLMNFAAGFLIVAVLYISMPAILSPQISGVAPEFAEHNETLLQEGDIFWSIQGERIYQYSDVDLLLSLYGGEPLDLVVLRDGEKVRVDQMPWTTYTSTDNVSQYEGYGLYRVNVSLPATAGSRLQAAWLNTVDFVRLVRLSLQMLVTGQVSIKEAGGPVAMVSIMTEAGQDSGNLREALDNILYYGALIAVNLSVMNLLPIPALDGGHILFLIIDTVSMKLFGKRIPEKYENKISTVFFVLLMVFMVLITIQDVWRELLKLF